MIPKIIIFERESFIFVNRKGKKFVIFVAPDLNLRKIDYEIFKDVYKDLIHWPTVIETYYRIRYLNLDLYLKSDSKVYGFYEKFRNNWVVVGFTGGKDSVVLVEALEKLNIAYKAFFIYIPFLEDPVLKLNRRIFEKYDVRIVPLDKEILLSNLSKGKLHYPNCYLRSLKNKRLREIAKEFGIKRKYILTGERIYESPTRYRYLINKAYRNPIQGLTNSEAFLFAASSNSLSKIYKYSLRVSCFPCSRASLTSFYLSLNVLKKVNKEAYKILIDGMRIAYEKHKYNISFEQFSRLGLYRFTEDVAQKILQNLRQLSNYSKRISMSRVFNILKKRYRYYIRLARTIKNVG